MFLCWMEMKKPNIKFFCIGTQKAGTTTLHNILKEHPDIYLPFRKETHYFDVDNRYLNGLEWFYKEFFSEYKDELIAGSFTASYSFYPKVPKRIFNDLGSDIKFIFVLRQPIDRAVSHYNMTKGRLYENLIFEEAIAQEKIRIQRGDFEFGHYSYFSRGYYSVQIERYFRFFPEEQFLFLDFDTDIVENLPETLIRIQNFLGVKVMQLNSNIHSNKAFSYQSNLFTKYLQSRNKNKKILKRIIPKNLRMNLREKILNLYTTDNKMSLSQGERQRYFNTYFQDDHYKVEKLSKLELSHWKD